MYVRFNTYKLYMFKIEHMDLVYVYCIEMYANTKLPLFITYFSTCTHVICNVGWAVSLEVGYLSFTVTSRKVC